MATATIDGGILHLELRTWDKVLAVHGSLHIPLQHITAARADTAPPVPMWTKLIGTNFPGWKAAGTFFTSDGLAFYDYDAGQTCLVLTLDHERITTAVVELDPPQSAFAIAGEIERARSALRSP